MSLAYAVNWDDIPEDIEEPEDEDQDDLFFCENAPTIDDCLIAGNRGVDIPNQLYHYLDGISGSKLELLMESNKHLNNAHLFNQDTSMALENGTLLHTAVLEPDELEERYLVAPVFDCRTNAGKALKANFYAGNKDKIIVNADDYRRIQHMARNVRAVYGDLIEAGIRERSYFALVDGVLLKSRPDIYDPVTGHDIDLKSISLGTKPFTDGVLESHIKKFNYHLSAALRLLVRRALGHVEGNSYLLFVDTGPGHRVRLIQIAPEWLEDSVEIVNDLLEGRRFYLETGIEAPVAIIDNSRRLSI